VKTLLSSSQRLSSSLFFYAAPVPEQKEAKRPSPTRTVSEEERLAALRVRQQALKKGGGT